MEINDFIEKVMEQFDDAPETLVATDKFRDVDGYSSLTALMLLSMFDEEYGVTVTGDDMRKMETIQDLFDLVQSRI